MKLTQEAADAINAARQEGRVTEGKAVRLPDDAPMTEKEFQRWVLLYAKAHGWLCYHTFDSRRSQAGFPDLVLVRMASSYSLGRVLFCELKSERGQLTLEQKEWGETLNTVGGNVEYHCWKPSDLAAIENVLALLKQPRT